MRLVQHKRTSQYYALKVLRKHEVIRLKQVEHVLSEKAILAEISHPFVVCMYGGVSRGRAS